MWRPSTHTIHCFSRSLISAFDALEKSPLDMIHPGVHRELDGLDPGDQPQKEGYKGHHDQRFPRSYTTECTSIMPLEFEKYFLFCPEPAPWRRLGTDKDEWRLDV